PLLTEFLPTVENGDGKRIGIAAGPIDLGEVPIIHRTLEPGYRITLGYPWFRIRPEGWRGEVLGPTCCAAPGRFKVGYTGLPLRLDDDKSDVWPGTGQVELDIRRSDASKDNHPAKEPLDSRVPEKTKEPAIKAWGTSVGGDWDPGSKRFFLQTRDFEVPFR